MTKRNQKNLRKGREINGNMMQLTLCHNAKKSSCEPLAEEDPALIEMAKHVELELIKSAHTLSEYLDKTTFDARLIAAHAEVIHHLLYLLVPFQVPSHTPSHTSSHIPSHTPSHIPSNPPYHNPSHSPSPPFLFPSLSLSASYP